MDLSPIVNKIIVVLWYLIPFVILVSVLKSPWFKGLLGEFALNLVARLALNKKDYHRINNVTLPTENGSTQIDHIIVSVFGVFVIETKNMKGWIFGGEHQKTWTQKIYKHSSKFQNPLHQNYKHVRVLQSFLGLKDHQLHSVVAFVGESTFKTAMPDNVTSGMGYIGYIKSKTTWVLTPLEVVATVEKIKAARLVRSAKTGRDHVRHVKTIVKKKQGQAD